MLTAYKKYWKNYVNFEGRSSRSDFWWVVLVNVLIAIIIGIIAGVIMFGTAASIVSDASSMDYYDDAESIRNGVTILSTLAPLWIINTLWGLANFLPALALTIRRLRDAGLHWAFIFLVAGPYLALMIPIVNILAIIAILPCEIAFIVLLCRPSKEEPINYQAGYQGAANQGQFGQNPGQFNQFNQGANPGQGQFGQNPGQFNQFNQGANPGQSQFGQNPGQFNQFNQGTNPEQGQFDQNPGQFNQFNQGANPGQGQFGQNPGQFNQFTPGANPEQGQFGQDQASFNQFNQANNPAQDQFEQNQEQGKPFPQAAVEEEPTVASPEIVEPSQEEANPFSAAEPIQDSATDSESSDSKE
ncbi:DUF805 domain-containing protein [Streptococcus oricebi]|uniref:DUF805 domain-containing protein n=1 Tax=Streptococcus oricebi TaxID=1547447 RepID=A0ABS5B3D9_9STRE|nr:DUF805 domain-containing protein [Streptococcus oricebi]MBP2623340.1 DUF805 domain-containing protein [Streptococcus oricebi]